MIMAAGLMSGTSLDGVDVAIVALSTADGKPQFELRSFETFPYDDDVRALLTSLLPPNTGTAQTIAVAHRRLGEIYADALQRALQGRAVDFIALHGQTVYHDGERSVTLQLGSPYYVRDRCQASVVFDFRSADCALGGHGAPLVPYVDALLLSSAAEDRVAVNLGGIANLTFLPKGGAAADATAFDSGPANILLDAFVSARTGGSQTFDQDGAYALRGVCNTSLLQAMSADPYFSQAAPKSTGRERFGAQFLEAHAAALDVLGLEDGAATLSALTAQTVADAVRSVAGSACRILVSGGGARNPAIMSELTKRLPGYRVETTDAMALPVDAKEAIAFALLGFQTLRGRPSNLPRVTGARAPSVLGAIAPYELDALLEKVRTA